ncbi:hypothetical protein PR202_gb19861 [Eleusine coracana subsp. coracana]|uniref:Peptidyl-tRNA hydrolase n=1 Tax=Eleusine coracana subsp. coracana TaxID=191504 RepID=A0AAV5F921_ELECO|nr:hypothetical protein PR202_gb19861 [Eleusine coracana subsp. coracana]
MLRKRLALFLSKRYISSFQTSSLSSSTVGSPIQPWLFIGLGNPGEKYQSTRHNVGFDMIDAFAQSEGIPMTTHYFKALFGEGMVDGVPILLAKPQTYMNLSGESVSTTPLLEIFYRFTGLCYFVGYYMQFVSLADFSLQWGAHYQCNWLSVCGIHFGTKLL